jgi:hypothetical protein
MHQELCLVEKAYEAQLEAVLVVCGAWYKIKSWGSLFTFIKNLNMATVGHGIKHEWFKL